MGALGVETIGQGRFRFCASTGLFSSLGPCVFSKNPGHAAGLPGARVPAVRSQGPVTGTPGADGHPQATMQNAHQTESSSSADGVPKGKSPRRPRACLVPMTLCRARYMPPVLMS